MPRIQEYLPDSSGQAPVGGLDPRTEAVGRVGAGVEKVGNALESDGAALYQAQAHVETSDASATASQMRVDYQQRVIDQTRDQTLDVDQLKKDYQDQVNQASQSYGTQAGRNLFNRLAARTGAYVQVQAMHGQSQIAAAKALQSWNLDQNARYNGLQQDPSSFQSVQSQTEEAIQAKIDLGVFTPMQAEQIRKEASQNNAIASVRGYALLGDSAYTGKDGSVLSGPDLAKHVLDSGQLNPYLSLQAKDQLYDYIDKVKRANDADAVRADTLQKRQDKEAFDNWLGQNLPAYANNTLSARAILSAPGDVESKKRLIDAVKENATKPFPGNPQLKENIFSKIQSGEINSTSQMLPYLGADKLSMEQFQKLAQEIPRTEGAKDQVSLEKTLYAKARKEFAITSGSSGYNMATGTFGSGDYDAFSRFQVAYNAKKQEIQKNGGSVSDLLLDPGNPAYFGNSLTTRFGSTTLKALSPPPPSKDNTSARKPGESPADYRKRMGF